MAVRPVREPGSGGFLNSGKSVNVNVFLSFLFIFFQILRGLLMCIYCPIELLWGFCFTSGSCNLGAKAAKRSHWSTLGLVDFDPFFLFV